MEIEIPIDIKSEQLIERIIALDFHQEDVTDWSDVGVFHDVTNARNLCQSAINFFFSKHIQKNIVT